MYDDNQINILPESIIKLSKLQILSLSSNQLSITEQDVIERCRLGLVGEQAVVTKPEADWVIRRLIELMSWS